MAILALALVLRLLYIAEISAKSPFFEHLVVDAETYHQSALEILHKAPPKEFTHQAFFQPPLYPYFLAAVYRVFSVSLLAPRIIQAILGALSCGLIFLIARKFFSLQVAVLSGFAAALYRSFIFFDGELLTVSLGTFLGLLGLYASVLALSEEYVDSRKKYGLIIGGGLSFGLFAITIPNILLFGGFLAGYILLRKSLRNRKLLLTCFLAGFLLPIAVTTTRNYKVSGQFVLISHNGGLNFYLGNNLRSEETTKVRPGRKWLEITHMPALETGRQDMTETEKSRHFFKKSFSYIFSHPFHYTSAQGKKTIRFFNKVEIPRNADFYYLKSFSVVLSYDCVTYLLVCPLALLGFYMLFKERRRLIILYAYFLLYFLSVLGFFVTGRYRIPAIPIMIIFACAAIPDLVRIRADRKVLAKYLLILAALFTFVSFDWFGDYVPPQDNPENFISIGRAYCAKGDLRRALACQTAALAIDPENAEIHFEIGTILRRMGDSQKARQAFQTACKLSPRDFAPYLALAALSEERGDYHGAIRYYAAAAQTGLLDNPTWYAVLVQLGRNHFHVRNYGESEQAFRAAMQIYPDNPDGLLCLGILYASTKRFNEAISVFKRVISLHPNSEEAHEGLLLTYIKKRDSSAVRALIKNAKSKGIPLDQQLLKEAQKLLGERAAR